jgi:beta propeller repeat protein
MKFNTFFCRNTKINVERRSKMTFLKQKKSILTLSVSILMFCSNTVWANMGGSRLQTPPYGKIRADTNNIVWMAPQSGNWDIYHMNQSTGVQTRITTNSHTQGYPDVWQNYVVWQDDRNHPGVYDIYLYHMNTKEEMLITPMEGNHQTPRIADGKVAWINHKEGKQIVMLYDILTQESKQISSHIALAAGIAMDRDTIAWMDTRGSSFDIYTYHIPIGQESQITYGLGDEVDPLVSQGKVVWMVNHNGISQVYMYDTDTKLTTKLTVGTENHRPLAFYGDTLVLIQGDRLTVNNTRTLTDQKIQAPNNIMPTQAFLIGNEVLWFDGKSVLKEAMNTALDRAKIIQQPENLKTPILAPIQPPSSNTHQEQSSSSLEQTSILIRKDTDTVLYSEDKQMWLAIKRGTFPQDVHMHISTKIPVPTADYEFKTPLYKWNIIEDIKPSKPIELSIATSVQKAWLHTMEEEIYKSMKEAKRVNENLLSAPVGEKGSALLSVYHKKFTDMDKHWSYEYVDLIASRQILTGYKDGTFQPNRKMTRGEFVKILVASMESEERTTGNTFTKFKDVGANHWAASYIQTAYENGWVEGYGEIFKPDECITREQMVTILMRIYDNIETNTVGTETSMHNYTDAEHISSWANKSMKKAVQLGWIQGYKNRLNPKGNTTRSEAAVMLYRYLKQLSKI